MLTCHSLFDGFSGQHADVDQIIADPAMHMRTVAEHGFLEHFAVQQALLDQQIAQQWRPGWKRLTLDHLQLTQLRNDVALTGNQLHRLGTQLFGNLLQTVRRQRAGHCNFLASQRIPLQRHDTPAQAELIGQYIGCRTFTGNVEHARQVVLKGDGLSQCFVVEPAMTQQNPAQRQLAGLLFGQCGLQFFVVDGLPGQQHATQTAGRDGNQVGGRKVVHGLVPDQLAVEHLAHQKHPPGPSRSHEVDEVADHHARYRQQAMLPTVKHGGEVAAMQDPPQQRDAVGHQ